MAETYSTLAQISALIYDQVEGWDNYWVIEDVVVARIGNTIVFRGSATMDDWLHNADMVPQWHSTLGYCHRGFLAHLDVVFDIVKEHVQEGFQITGHSLGGARARLLGGLFIVNNKPPKSVVTFGAPKPAFVNLRRLYEKSTCDHVSFKNRNDIVVTLPHAFDYVHTENYIEVNAAPAEDNFDALRDHSSLLYVKAFA